MQNNFTNMTDNVYFTLYESVTRRMFSFRDFGDAIFYASYIDSGNQLGYTLLIVVILACVNMLK